MKRGRGARTTYGRKRSLKQRTRPSRFVKRTMPSTYRRKRYYRKTSYNRGFRRLATKGRFPGVSFPERASKKFIWEAFSTLDSSSFNVVAAYTLRSNSLFDPQYDLGGNAPLNYSTFLNSIVYHRYMVMGAAVTVEFTNLGGSVAKIIPSFSDVPNVITPGASELTFMNATILPWAGKLVYVGPLSSGKNIVTRKYYIKPWVPLGITRQQYYNDPVNHAGIYNNNPNSVSYFTLNMVGAGGQALVQFRMKVTFYSILMDLGDTFTVQPKVDQLKAEEQRAMVAAMEAFNLDEEEESDFEVIGDEVMEKK